MNIQDAVNALELLGCTVEPIYTHGKKWIEGLVVDTVSVVVGKIHQFRGELTVIRWFRRSQDIKNRWEYYVHCDRVLSETDYTTLCETGDGFTMPRRAPWLDWEGRPILENDMIQHPDGSMGQVAFFDQFHGAANQWRVIYDDEQGTCEMLRLCIQVGDRGMARIVI